MKVADLVDADHEGVGALGHGDRQDREVEGVGG